MAGDKTMMIALIAGGGCCLLLIIGLIVYFVMYYNKEEDTASSSSTPSPTTPTKKSSTSPSPNPSPNPSPSPAPASVTINGQTFDPTGYTIGSSWFWNKTPLTGYTNSTSSNASECRQRCIDRSPPCYHFARAESDGMCYLNETYGGAIDPAHVMGIKKDGSNEYSKPVHIGGYDDTSRYYDNPSMKQEMTISECAQKCTSNADCTAWIYRTSRHSDPGFQRTCVTMGESGNSAKFREGNVGI